MNHFENGHELGWIGHGMDPKAMFKDAVLKGDLIRMKVMLSPGGLSREEIIPLCKRAFICAIHCNHLHILKWLSNTGMFDYSCDRAAREFKRNSLYAIAGRGHLNILMWFTERFNPTARDFKYGRVGFRMDSAFATAALYGNLNVLKWITNRFQLTTEDVRMHENCAFQDAASGGRLQVLEWLTSRFDLKKEDATAKDNWAFRCAASKGHLDVLNWLATTFDLKKKDATAGGNSAFCEAAKEGHLHVLNWLATTFDLKKKDATAGDNFAIRLAAWNGHLEVLKWLTKEFGLTEEDARARDNFAFQWAAKEGRVGVCKWMICMNFVPDELGKDIRSKLVDQKDFEECMPFAPGMEKYIVAEIYRYAFGAHKL